VELRVGHSSLEQSSLRGNLNSQWGRLVAVKGKDSLAWCPKKVGPASSRVVDMAVREGYKFASRRMCWEPSVALQLGLGCG
jgi:hypothetical protein